MTPTPSLSLQCLSRLACNCSSDLPSNLTASAHTLAGMAAGKLLATLLVVCTVNAQSQDLVILGDSLSDGGSSGNGYSDFVKLVLQTNDVSYARPEGSVSESALIKLAESQETGM